MKTEILEKKENVNEKVGKKETYTERIKRNIVTILRYNRSSELIIIKTNTKINIKILVKLLIIMT